MTILDCRFRIAEFYELLIPNLAEDKKLTKAAKSQLATHVNLKSEIRNLQYSITPSILDPLRGQDNLISSWCEYLLFLDNLDGDFGCHISMYLNRNLVFTQGLYRFI